MQRAQTHICTSLAIRSFDRLVARARQMVYDNLNKVPSVGQLHTHTGGNTKNVAHPSDRRRVAGDREPGTARFPRTAAAKYLFQFNYTKFARNARTRSAVRIESNAPHLWSRTGCWLPWTSCAPFNMIFVFHCTTHTHTHPYSDRHAGPFNGNKHKIVTGHSCWPAARVVHERAYRAMYRLILFT